MGQHSICGVLTGKPLSVVGKGAKHVARHRISGGEYTTVDHVLSSGNDCASQRVGITYCIAPQGPGQNLYLDQAHPKRRPGDYVGVWRRPPPSEQTKFVDFLARRKA